MSDSFGQPSISAPISPRIGIAPPRPMPAASEVPALLAVAVAHLKRADIDWCLPFNKAKGQYRDRCSVPFQWAGAWYVVALCQLRKSDFEIQVREHGTNAVMVRRALNITPELADAPA